MKLLYLSIILFSSLSSAFAEECVSEKLFMPKYMLMNAGEEGLSVAFDLLDAAKDSNKTGEVEFYMSAIKYRQHLLLDSQTYMKQSHEKHFFLSNAFYATAYYFGLFGYDKDEKKMNKYFSQFLESSKVCDSMSKEMEQPEQIFSVILKIFPVPKETLNKKLKLTSAKK